MPLIATRGAASAQGFGEFAQTAVATYIEDVFSTYLYTGNGSTQTITNGIDLSGEGGMTWLKARTDTTNNLLFDTARGNNKAIFSNLTNAQTDYGGSVFVFDSSGFSIGTGSTAFNGSSINYTSWTFREQPKFFDIVTYTGNGTAGRTVSHNLGSTPGTIIIKNTSVGTNWAVYHRSMGATKYMRLNITNGEATSSNYWNDTEPTSTQFTLGVSTDVNDIGYNYVAYLFAHNAGGFGLAGDQNVISCGSYTGTGGTTTPNQINLGYEAQWVLVKPSSGVGNWAIADMMRGSWIDSDSSANFNELVPNTADAENPYNYGPAPTANGFAVSGVGFPNASGVTYIYIAIRRGPMKTPASGTSVFTPITATSTAGDKQTTGFSVDTQMIAVRAGLASNTTVASRLTSVNTNASLNPQPYLVTTNTAGQSTATNRTRYWDNTGYQLPGFYDGASTIYWSFGRAPGFFDVVCYTGTGVTRTVNHNLSVAPELIIVKRRNTTASWAVYAAPLTASYAGFLDLNNAFQADNLWDSTAPTSTVFTVRSANIQVNASGSTYVAYLFASVSGVSKVGSYTGNGSSQTINCGFTNGARFVLIKRTDSTGDWYVWDSARGIVAGNDPYLLLNSTAAEVTNTDYVDTYSAGFEISSTAPAAINANGGTFIFLAIA